MGASRHPATSSQMSVPSSDNAPSAVAAPGAQNQTHVFPPILTTMLSRTLQTPFPPSGSGTWSSNDGAAFCKQPAGAPVEGGKSRKFGVGAVSYRRWCVHPWCFNDGVYPFGCGAGCLKATCNGIPQYVATVDAQTGPPHIGDLWYPSDPDTRSVIRNWGATICGGNLCSQGSPQMLVCQYEEVNSSFCWE